MAVGGVALDSTVSASPITYGMTLSFTDNTYTYWIGTPTSGPETWVSRFANYTGPVPGGLGSVTIDNVNWGIDFYSAGNSFNLDQIQVSMVPIPEPSVIALAGAGMVGLLSIRRRG